VIVDNYLDFVTSAWLGIAETVGHWHRPTNPRENPKRLKTQPMPAALLRRHTLPRDQGLRGFDDFVDAGGGVAVGHELDFDSAGDGVGDEGTSEGFERFDLAFDFLSSFGESHLRISEISCNFCLFRHRRKSETEPPELLAR